VYKYFAVSVNKAALKRTLTCQLHLNPIERKNVGVKLFIDQTQDLETK
jgi:hypothetical protein